MPTRMRRLRPALLAIGLATGCVGCPADGVADDCLSKPNAPSPPGQHWYYHLDRATHRECWYLGVAGAKLHQRAQPTSSPERPSAPKPVAQPVPQPRAVAAASEPANTEIVHEEAPAAPDAPDDAASALPARGPSLPAATAPVIPKPGSMRSSYAKEQAASETEREDEMPLVWPILSPAELAAVQQPDASMTSFAQLAAALAMVLGLVALIARVVFRFSAARKRMPVKAPGQRSATARREMTRRPPKPGRLPRNAASDMEANVRGLLHELQQRQHDDRDFQRVSRQVA
jgi:hypothetical protein